MRHGATDLTRGSGFPACADNRLSRVRLESLTYFNICPHRELWAERVSWATDTRGSADPRFVQNKANRLVRRGAEWGGETCKTKPTCLRRLFDMNSWPRGT